MWCFEGEELDLLQRHEITTAEKSFMCHSNFTQGSHVGEVDNAFRNNTVNAGTNSDFKMGVIKPITSNEYSYTFLLNGTYVFV